MHQPLQSGLRKTREFVWVQDELPIFCCAFPKGSTLYGDIYKQLFSEHLNLGAIFMVIHTRCLYKLSLLSGSVPCKQCGLLLW